MDKILMIIGNGLSIDLWKYLGLNIHPSSPFSFGVPDPFDQNKKLLDKLSRVKCLINTNSSTDFEIIQHFIEHYDTNNQEHKWIHSELRQYLSLAYSYANSRVLSHWKNNWSWEKWIGRFRENIVGAVCFNYDLTLETALNRLSLKYYRTCSSEEDNAIGIPIFKPHGSCDFDISSGAIHMSPEAKLENLTFLNEYIVNGKGRVDIVPKEKLLEPRTESDIVLPLEFSPQTGLTWVRQGYEIIDKLAKDASTCIIVGISYQHCDRQEVNVICKALTANTDIQVIDPTPNKDLISNLKIISNIVKTLSLEEFEGYYE
jgi:hypothetical protein